MHIVRQFTKTNFSMDLKAIKNGLDHIQTAIESDSNNPRAAELIEIIKTMRSATERWVDPVMKKLADD